MRGFIYDMIHNNWSCGYGFYDGKPKFFIGREWVDGWQYGFHLGPFWVCCTTF